MTVGSELGQGAGVLSHAAVLVHEARADFAAQSRTLDGQIQAVRGRWVGSGAQAFFALHAGWQERHRQVMTALDRLATSLTATERDNLATDSQAADDVRGLRSRLEQVRA